MAKPKLDVHLLKSIVQEAEKNQEGSPADYIPELAFADKELTALAVWPKDGKPLYYSNTALKPVTLQSTAKLIPLIGLIEEFGVEALLKWVMVEPSGDDFSSITRLEQFGPMPSNPMLNAGAIALCSHIPGEGETQFAWLEHWVERLFNERLSINPRVFASEKRTGDRNRSLAYLLQSKSILGSDIRSTLELYFALCSYEASLMQIIYLPTLLANGGLCPLTGERKISQKTCQITISVMATCGLYDESGTHLVNTGMPAKSGVSGYIIACLPGVAGVATLNALVNKKGNSVRGGLMLQALSEKLGWHFATP